MARYTDIRVVPGTPATLLGSDEAFVPTRYFGTNEKGEEVELLSTSDYYAGRGPESTAYIAKPLGGQYKVGEEVFMPFEAVDAEGNVIGTWNMLKNQLGFVNTYIAPAIKAAATILAGQAIMPSVSGALGLESAAATPTDVPTGGASYAPGSFKEFLATEGITPALATPVPGSLQAFLPTVGVTPLIQGGVQAGTAGLFNVNYGLGDTLTNLGKLAGSLSGQPTVQQQAGLVSSGASQPRGVDYSGLLSLLQGKAGLLPTAEPYRRSLL